MALSPVAASFRDPAGFVVCDGGRFKRIVTTRGKDDYEALMDSGLYAELVAAGLLIPHEEEPVGRADGRHLHKVLCPQQIDYVSYPYEWCFSELRDAALLTLELQARALGHGLSLKDASAFNVQFQNGRPVFIDTLSFERARGGPWIAYEQFCRHFLAPLLLISSHDLRANQYLRVDLDGVPLDLASRLLRWPTYLRPSVLLHVHLHARAQRSASVPSSSNGSERASLRLKKNLTESLRRAVEAIRLPRRRTLWSDYQCGEDHYSAAAMAFKSAFVEKVVGRTSARRVYDCGGNSGAYSFVAAACGCRCVLLEADPWCVEMAYRTERASGAGRVLPLVMDLGNPTPALGVNACERFSLLERPTADLVMALALIHHLRIRQNIAFERLAQLFRRLGRTLILEFVPPEDPLAAPMLRSAPCVEDYTLESVLHAFGKQFRLLERASIPDSGRSLLLFEAGA